MKTIKSVFTFCLLLISLSFAQEPATTPESSPAPAVKPSVPAAAEATLKDQGPAITFEKVKHDFGEIQEDGGKAEIEFIYKNEGKEPLVLNNVKASCGCTTPEWTKEPIAPGESGTIKAIYNPFNRPGKFTKTISVKSNGTPPVQTLWITGTVLPRVKGVKDWYPYEEGNLRFTKNHLSFGKMLDSESDTSSTVVYNQGDTIVKIFPKKSDLPPYITIEAESWEVAPEKTIKLLFKYDASKVDQYGFVFKRFNLVTSDDEKTEKRMNVSAEIKQDFSKMSAEDKKNAPKLKLAEMEYDFGDVKEGEIPTGEIKITNEGKSTLVIHKVKASAGGVVATPITKNLQPGESTNLSIRLFTQGRDGLMDRKLTVISNDPNNSELEVVVKGTVVK